MKIPETSANVGAYYGNEENGQWQPNGVILDGGVGGGVVGSGDAGALRPPYPVHMPRPHLPAGYVMAGAYYPTAAYPPVPAQPQDDFADYMWMENEEEFDKQVMQQLEEEALMEQCIEAMLEDEQRERQNRPLANGHKHHRPTTSNGGPSVSLEETVSRSKLNPLAAEFVPTRARPPPPPPSHAHAHAHSEDRQERTEKPVAKEVQHAKGMEQNAVDAELPAVTNDSKPEITEEPMKEEPVTPPKDPPEVSAADIQPISDKPLEKRPKDPRKEQARPKPDPKKHMKVDIKPKVKPQVVKSETKLQPKKKEVKSVKSDMKVEEKTEEIAVHAVEAPKPQPTPVEEVQANAGMKPINYAAAAKANKPKKPTTPPASDKSTPPPLTQKPKPVEKKDKKPEKPLVKTDKPNIQRKNSAK